jgi:hypothetical protein
MVVADVEVEMLVGTLVVYFPKDVVADVVVAVAAVVVAVDVAVDVVDAGYVGYADYAGYVDFALVFDYVAHVHDVVVVLVDFPVAFGFEYDAWVIFDFPK